IEDPCAEADCGDNGRCVVSGSGVALCVCNDGFRADGLTCVPIENPCSGVTCSGRGTCVVTGSGDAFCICNEGYHNFDNHCLVEDPCLGVGCSGHGTCTIDDDDTALCVCEEGYRNFGYYCLQVDDCVTVANCSDDWCLIPACTFKMGAPEDEECRWGQEGPARLVTITRSFYMKQTEVRQGEWFDLIGNNPSGFSGCGPNCPVERVNWYDAVYYANELSEAEGLDQCYTITDPTGDPGTGNYSATVTFKGLHCKGYRLPTEAEWEYAARAGTKTAYWIGSNITDGGDPVCEQSDDNAGILLPEAAWYSYNSNWRTHPVAQKAANPFGLYDVHGNVWEWVHDWYDPDYFSNCPDDCVDPVVPSEGSKRGHRGGSWYDIARALRSAVRSNGPPVNFHNNVGFRLVRTAPFDED
ncbi:MAG TPA: formylglycine-generating enzyme family protein, partial [Oligoflexales bacterium]|nr:formylglycine-generating enzyme family protein [Oligoflexales bacterium]